MLRALLHSKSRKRVELAAFGNDYEGSEDLLTAAVFSRLTYLSDETLGSLLTSLCPGLAWESVGPLVEVHFWPRIPIEDRIVEPDVIFEFNAVALCIEAKRWDGISQQSTEQLSSQFSALRAHYPGEMDIVQIAVGGLGRSLGDLAQVKPAPMFISWGKIAIAVDRLLPASRAEQRVLLDIKSALRLHKVYPEMTLDLRTLSAVAIGTDVIHEWKIATDWEGLSQAKLRMVHFPGW